MSKIIAFSNHKGGVAKTTTVANIACILAHRGYKVLMIDLDPQFNLTSNFIEYSPEVSIYDSFCKNQELPIIEIRNNLYIVPSSLQHTLTETQLATTMCRETILKQRLKNIKGEYNYILLDCPPSLGLITINALAASTNLIIPITAEVFPIFGMSMIIQFLQNINQQLNPDLKIDGLVFTRWENNNLSKQAESLIKESFPDSVFETRIRKNVSVASAPMILQTVFDMAPNSNGSKDYEQLTEELLRKI